MMATDAADGHVTGPDAVDKNAIFAGANLVAQADEDGREITHAIWRRHSKASVVVLLLPMMQIWPTDHGAYRLSQPKLD